MTPAMKTFSAKPETVKRDWYVIDASGKVLGRLATEVARRLRGKHKAEFTPHVDTGDYIVVVNAEKVLATGKKDTDKFYHSYSGYQSGLKSISLSDMRRRGPRDDSQAQGVRGPESRTSGADPEGARDQVISWTDEAWRLKAISVPAGARRRPHA
jgi:ribosomal protein L13